MKKINAILLTIVVALTMMPLGVFADAYDFRSSAPSKPIMENIEEWVVESYGNGANAIYYDNPVFETEYMFDIEDQETETLGGNMAPIRPKMDCNIEIGITSNYAGNIYLGAWTVEEQNGESVAVKLGESIKAGSPSVALQNIKNNEMIMLIISLCNDFSSQQLGSYELKLNATARPTGDKPATKCIHIPIKVDREEPCCGFNGSKAHWVCEDCWTWLIKDKATGEFRKMTKEEKKAKTLKMPAKKHSFTKKVRNADTRIRKASCTKAAKYYYTCKYCGIIGNKTFTYGKKLGHNFKKNYAIPATTEKDGKLGTICTRCKKVKANTDTSVIPMIDAMSFVADPYVVDSTKGELPSFTIKDVNGNIINKKWYTVGPMTFFDEEMPSIPLDIDMNGQFESSLVMAMATFSGRYGGTAFISYVETSHAITDEWTEKVKKYIENNVG